MQTWITYYDPTHHDHQTHDDNLKLTSGNLEYVVPIIWHAFFITWWISLAGAFLIIWCTTTFLICGLMAVMDGQIRDLDNKFNDKQWVLDIKTAAQMGGAEVTQADINKQLDYFYQYIEPTLHASTLTQ